MVVVQAPNPVYKAICAFYGTIVPLGIPFRGADEKGVDTDGIRAVAIDQWSRADDIPLRFGHLSAVSANHALREQPLERLIEIDEPFVVEELDDERLHHGTDIGEGIEYALEKINEKAVPLDTDKILELLDWIYEKMTTSRPNNAVIQICYTITAIKQMLGKEN